MRNQWRHFLHRYNHLHYPLYPPKSISSFYSTLQISPSNSSNILLGLFSDPSSHHFRIEMRHQVSILRDELIKSKADSDNIHAILQDLGCPLFSSFSSAFVELLTQLHNFPLLALQVFDWRRKQASFSFPITSEEYAKGITVAGRAKDVDLAVELFTEAVNNRVQTSSTYNALMGVYMVNGLTQKCQSLFSGFKKEGTCRPTTVTHNILISVFGRLMLIDHMEATLQEMYDSYLTPNVSTFNNLICGYVTAWMWDRMENTYRTMIERHIQPDIHTYRLLVRGYAHSGNFEKMEEMYELLTQHSDMDNYYIVKCMICAYCKSSCANRIEKIDILIKLIPESEYRPWLIVLLIKFYAQERLLEKMETYINVAFDRHTAVTNAAVMRLITTAYFKFNAVDKLSSFVKRAEDAGWRLCRTLYHSRMVLYASQNRLEEMENVLGEMEKFNIDNRSVKTLAIMVQAYSRLGPSCKLKQVMGLMCRYGYRIPIDKFPL